MPIVLEKQSHQPDQRQHGEDYNSEENNNHRFHDLLLILYERMVSVNDFNLSPLSEEVKKSFTPSRASIRRHKTAAPTPE